MNEHDQVQLLIPWYVNGSLDEPDMMQVTSHLERCPACAEDVRSSLAQTRTLNQAADAIPIALSAASRHFAELRSRLPTGTAARHTTHRSRPRSARIAVTAALAALVATTLLWQGSRTYETLTTTSASQGVVLQVIFYPETTEADVREVLLGLDGGLVGKPSPGGLYRFALHSADAAERALGRLRASPAVRWAEIER